MNFMDALEARSLAVAKISDVAKIDFKEMSQANLNTKIVPNSRGSLVYLN